jgi:hypothetical protein
LVTGQQWDILGNLVKVTDPGGHETTTAYTDAFTDSTNRNSFAYPARVTQPSGFYVDTVYDFKTGLVMSATDSLSRTTTHTYDVMNREIETELPNGGWITNSFNDNTQTVTTEKLVDSQNNVGRVIIRYDKLYREIQKETADPAGNIFVDTQYDGNGRKWKVSNPYR